MDKATLGELLRTGTMQVANIRERGDAIDGAAIRDVLSRIANALYPGLAVEEIEYVARQIEERMDIVIGLPDVLISKDWEPWLNAVKAEIDPFYWDRYRDYLIQQGLPPFVLASLSETTDRLLDLLHNPIGDEEWDRRGLVMGNVQSGKTGNYIGLIAKAADAGFKVIIVIAGIHNNLRNQTQARVDAGFIGSHRNQAADNKAEKVGVGLIDDRHKPIHFTTSKRDFSKATASAVGVSLSALNQPAVFVIKKNATTLKNLVEWLKDHNRVGDNGPISSPLLVIDDEADNASINVATKMNEISRINGLIRELLSSFSRSAYVGYTATPFANIFIDPDSDDQMVKEELFPRSFIVSLDAPNNYMSPRGIFLDDEDDAVLRTIDDHVTCLPFNHKKSLLVDDLPDSLIEALRTFVVTRAIRVARGQGDEHASMLVNVSRFIDVQQQLRNVLHLELSDIVNAIRVNYMRSSAEALRDAEMTALHATFETEFPEIEFDWADLQPLLLEAAASITVVEINGRSTGLLNYDAHTEKGLHVVAVGGLALSRGLTLEGLSTTYFLRNSLMYDTLLQMGRWFGYRPGYDDLVRIWMTSDSAASYALVAAAVEELREDLREMERAGGTPADFGLKVRHHPASLMVTARNKMGRGEVVTLTPGLSAELIETSVLLPAAREANLANSESFLDELLNHGSDVPEPKEVPEGWFIPGVRLESVRRFLKGYRNHDEFLKTEPELVLSYIDGRVDELATWDVLVASLASQSAGPHPMAGLTIQCAFRAADPVTSEKIVLNKHRLGSRGVEKVGLTNEEILEARSAHEAALREKALLNGLDWLPDGRINYPDRIYRKIRKRPLLILYTIFLGKEDKKSEKKPLGPWAGWAISFPTTERSLSHRAYVVNKRWLDEYLRASDEDDEDLPDDDQ